MPDATTAQDEARQPKPETRITRVLIPAKPHPKELALAIAMLGNCTRFDLAFQEASLGEILRTITKLSAVNISVSKNTAQKNVTLHLRGDLTLFEVFDQVSRNSPWYIVLERNGMTRVLSAEEYAVLAKAKDGSIGEFVPAPDYYPQFEFRMVAHAAKGELDVDLATERKRLKAWFEKGDNRNQVLQNPLRIVDYLNLTSERGGRLSKDIRWFPYRITAPDGKQFRYTNAVPGPSAKATLALFSPDRHGRGPTSRDDYLVEFIAVNMKERGFTTMDLRFKSLQKSKDPVWGTLLLYEMNEDSAKVYSDLTARNIGRGMAMILDGYLISAPILQSRIPGVGMIAGIPEAKIDRILRTLKK